MSKDVIIRGVTYQGIDKLSLPISGGSALFRDTSGADAAAADIVRGKTAYGASGLITGTHDLPSGSIIITDNGVYDVTDYASAVVSVSGGGGGPTASDAILTVKAPANSIVTMSKGNTTLTPTLWTTAADSGLECALFVIEPSLFDSQNAWTVTATSGSSTASDTVVIDDNLQYEMVLSFGLYLYANGVIETAVSGGFEAVKINGSTGTWTITNANNILTFFDRFTSGATATTVLFRTVNKIALGTYTTLTLVVESLTTATQRPTVLGLFAADPSGETNTWNNQAAALAEIPVSSSQETITINIASLSRSNTYYIGCGLYSRSGSPATLDISAFYLT